jgi:hypothetical protein
MQKRQAASRTEEIQGVEPATTPHGMSEIILRAGALRAACTHALRRLHSTVKKQSGVVVGLSDSPVRRISASSAAMSRNAAMRRTSRSGCVVRSSYRTHRTCSGCCVCVCVWSHWIDTVGRIYLPAPKRSPIDLPSAHPPARGCSSPPHASQRRGLTTSRARTVR